LIKYPKKILIVYDDEFPIALNLAREFELLSIKTNLFIPNKTEHWLNRFVFKKLNKLARNLRIVPKGTDLFMGSKYSYTNYLELQFSKRINEFRPELIFCIHGQRFGQKILSATKIPKIAWWIEPDPNKETLTYHARPFDLYLSYDSEIVAYLNQNGITSKYQSHVSDTIRYHPIQNSIKTTDILFYGNWSEWREEILHSAYIVTKNIALYGNGWPKKSRLFTKRQLKEIYRGKEINGSKLNEQINAAKLVLNAQRLKGNTVGIDTRPFDVLASGNLLLTDAPNDLHQHFLDKKDLLIYSDPCNLQRIIKEILSNQIDVEIIKKSGREKVLENYTYKNLCSTILEVTSRNEKTHRANTVG
jgi:spore maturation protein CgeB